MREEQSNENEQESEPFSLTEPSLAPPIEVVGGLGVFGIALVVLVVGAIHAMERNPPQIESPAEHSAAVSRDTIRDTLYLVQVTSLPGLELACYVPREDREGSER